MESEGENSNTLSAAPCMRPPPVPQLLRAGQKRLFEMGEGGRREGEGFAPWLLLLSSGCCCSVPKTGRIRRLSVPLRYVGMHVVQR